MNIKNDFDLKKYLAEGKLTEETYNKQSLLKALGDADDALIRVGSKEYIIYNPDSNNDDNAQMWGDDTIFAVNKDGEEHEFNYSEIDDIINESNINEEEYDPEEDEFEDPDAASGPGIDNDGWDEDYFEGMGLMDVLADAAKLSYEIKNARRGSYAVGGDSLKDIQVYVEELIDRLHSIQDKLEDPNPF